MCLKSVEPPFELKDVDPKEVVYWIEDDMEEQE